MAAMDEPAVELVRHLHTQPAITAANPAARHPQPVDENT